MKRLRLLVLVGLCALVPGVARADNGGWLDWLYSLDAKLVGVGTEFHVCVDDTGKVINCEKWFNVPKILGKSTDIDYKAIKHEFDFRVGYYHNYGDRFKDDPTDLGNVKAWKLMVLYHYHADDHLAVGFGAGFMPFYGRGRDGITGFESFSRGILTPLSVIYAPFSSGPANVFFLRAESSYLTQGFTAADFGNAVSHYATSGGEWNFSVALGVDFRRPHTR